MRHIFVILTLFLISFHSTAAVLTEVATDKKIAISDFVKSVQPGEVILLGESHATSGQEPKDQNQQVVLLNALLAEHNNVSVGMEFITYTAQAVLDSYLNQNLSQDDFIKQAGWGSNPFEAYRSQILLPLQGQGWTYGINSPSHLTRFVSQNGLAQITPELDQLLPPYFELGSPLYKERFLEQLSYLSHHGMNLENYFEAQSIWDDTMAWQISEIMSKDPQQILVVIVGQFHVMYNLGLPARLKARGLNNIKSIVQMSVYSDLNGSELRSLINDPKYGVIADFIW